MVWRVFCCAIVRGVCDDEEGEEDLDEEVEEEEEAATADLNCKTKGRSGK